MAHRNWGKVADEQFESLSNDIQQDWGELHELTSKR
jgi:hypothetical protein